MLKVGDRVRVVKDPAAGDGFSEVGSTGTVIAIKGVPGFNAFVKLDHRAPGESYIRVAGLLGLPTDGIPFEDDCLEKIDV